MKTTFAIKGMHCTSCKALIEDVVSEIPGVASCAVDVEAERADVEHDDSFDPERMRKDIEALGDYRVSVQAP